MDAGDEFLRRNVYPEVKNLEPSTFEQGSHKIFSNIVQVSLNGPDDDTAQRAGPTRDEQRSEQLEGTLHSTRGNQQLRHEIVAALKTLPHFVHGRYQRVVNQVQRVRSFGKVLVRQRASGLGIALNHRLLKVNEIGHRWLDQ